MEQKSYIILKENSLNGCKPLRFFLMMIAIAKKKPQMLDLDLNWITGDKECKKSPIKENSLKAEISYKLKIT